MSKFIKVTEAVSGKRLMIPMSNIDYIEDGLICLLGGDSVQMVGTIKTIEDGILRGEFAKHAMNAGGSDQDIKCDDLARWSYLVADAMLKERMK